MPAAVLVRVRIRRADDAVRAVGLEGVEDLQSKDERIPLGEAVPHVVQIDLHPVRLVDGVVRGLVVSIVVRLLEDQLLVVAPSALGAGAFLFQRLDAVAKGRAVILAGVALEVALVPVDEEARDAAVVAVGALLKIFQCAGEGVGGAAADVALVLDGREVRAQVDEGRQLVGLPLRRLVVGV